MHTGAGDIHINVGPQLQESDKPSFRRLAEDQLIRLRRVLIAPPGMGDARALLADTGTVILDGAPGSGRTSTARVLLREHHGDTGVFHELLPGEEDGLPLHDRALVGNGDQLLLDLSAADDQQWTTAQADLSALRKTVQEQHAHLVVVMPHGSALDPDLQYYRIEIEHPNRLDVFRQHLRMHGLPHSRRPTQQHRHRISQREQADARDRGLRRPRAPRQGYRSTREYFEHWCETARGALNDYRKDVAEKVAALSEAPQRALLIVVSTLHGAHADVVDKATQLLLRTVGPPSERTPLLQHKDLAQRLGEVSAAVGSGGQVRFDKLDYDAAVLTHFWDHMPDLALISVPGQQTS